MEEFELDTGRLVLRGLKNESEEGILTVFLHGWLDNAGTFVPLLKELSLTTPYFAIDLPGHGKSEHRAPSTTYFLLENILDVVTAIKLLSPNNKVNLVGHSLGGIVAALTAAAAPDSVDKLVLLDSLGPQTDTADHSLLQLRRSVKRMTNRSESQLVVYPKEEDAIEARTRGIGNISREASRHLCKRGLKQVSGGYSWSSDPRLMDPSMIRLSEEQLRSILSGVECKTSLICGEDGFLAKYPTLKDRLGYFKDITTHIVPGGHHFHLDGDVEKTSFHIKEFLYA